MNQQEAFELSRNEGTKITHTYFTPDEYLTIHGSMIVFEDGVKISIEEWTKGKDYLNDGWSVWKEL